MQVKIHEMIKKSGKTILQIASETGLNRNTVSGLANGQVEGLRLSTLQAFQKAYGWRLGDMVGEDEETPVAPAKQWYVQEGELVPFTGYPVVFAACIPYAIPQIKEHAQEMRLYIQDDYGFAYWSDAGFKMWSRQVWNTYREGGRWQALFEDYLRSAQVLEDLYLFARRATAFPANLEHAREVHREVSDAYERFWCRSLFIDAFDVGVDQEVIREIKNTYQISDAEAQILLTPAKMTFDRERRHALLKLVARWRKLKREMSLENWLHYDPEAERFRQSWGFVQNNYARIREISLEHVKADMELILARPDQGLEELKELDAHTGTVQAQVDKILHKHGWQENPLAFFANLTYWREHRKKANLMGIHVLFKILEVLEVSTGIPTALLSYLAPQEIESVLHGVITRQDLERRRKEGVMIVQTASGYRIHVGEEARSLREECEDKKDGGTASEQVLMGQVASQGYAKGVARIILREQDFHRFETGDILVTGMTRPEFVPLMKRAAGIVTNEGGITCHAAIISRELGKPCVIGTRRATEIIHEGDIVEVRANHGTVRVLKSG